MTLSEDAFHNSDDSNVKPVDPIEDAFDAIADAELTHLADLDSAQLAQLEAEKANPAKRLQPKDAQKIVATRQASTDKFAAHANAAQIEKRLVAVNAFSNEIDRINSYSPLFNELVKNIAIEQRSLHNPPRGNASERTAANLPTNLDDKSDVDVIEALEEENASGTDLTEAVQTLLSRILAEAAWESGNAYDALVATTTQLRKDIVGVKAEIKDLKTNHPAAHNIKNLESELIKLEANLKSVLDSGKKETRPSKDKQDEVVESRAASILAAFDEAATYESKLEGLRDKIKSFLDKHPLNKFNDAFAKLDASSVDPLKTIDVIDKLRDAVDIIKDKQSGIPELDNLVYAHFKQFIDTVLSEENIKALFESVDESKNTSIHTYLELGIYLGKIESLVSPGTHHHGSSAIGDAIRRAKSYLRIKTEHHVNLGFDREIVTTAGGNKIAAEGRMVEAMRDAQSKVAHNAMESEVASQLNAVFHPKVRTELIDKLDASPNKGIAEMLAFLTVARKNNLNEGPLIGTVLYDSEFVNELDRQLSLSTDKSKARIEICVEEALKSTLESNRQKFHQDQDLSMLIAADAGKAAYEKFKAGIAAHQNEQENAANGLMENIGGVTYDKKKATSKASTLFALSARLGLPLSLENINQVLADAGSLPANKMERLPFVQHVQSPTFEFFILSQPDAGSPPNAALDKRWVIAIKGTPDLTKPELIGFHIVEARTIKELKHNQSSRAAAIAELRKLDTEYFTRVQIRHEPGIQTENVNLYQLQMQLDVLRSECKKVNTVQGLGRKLRHEALGMGVTVEGINAELAKMTDDKAPTEAVAKQAFSDRKKKLTAARDALTLLANPMTETPVPEVRDAIEAVREAMRLDAEAKAPVIASLDYLVSTFGGDHDFDAAKAEVARIKANKKLSVAELQAELSKVRLSYYDGRLWRRKLQDLKQAVLEDSRFTPEIRLAAGINMSDIDEVASKESLLTAYRKLDKAKTDALTLVSESALSLSGAAYNKFKADKKLAIEADPNQLNDLKQAIVDKEMVDIQARGGTDPHVDVQIETKTFGTAPIVKKYFFKVTSSYKLTIPVPLKAEIIKAPIVKDVISTPRVYDLESALDIYGRYLKVGTEGVAREAAVNFQVEAVLAGSAHSLGRRGFEVAGTDDASAYIERVKIAQGLNISLDALHLPLVPSTDVGVLKTQHEALQSAILKQSYSRDRQMAGGLSIDVKALPEQSDDFLNFTAFNAAERKLAEDVDKKLVQRYRDNITKAQALGVDLRDLAGTFTKYEEFWAVEEQINARMAAAKHLDEVKKRALEEWDVDPVSVQGAFYQINRQSEKAFLQVADAIESMIEVQKQNLIAQADKEIVRAKWWGVDQARLDNADRLIHDPKVQREDFNLVTQILDEAKSSLNLLKSDRLQLTNLDQIALIDARPELAEDLIKDLIEDRYTDNGKEDISIGEVTYDRVHKEFTVKVSYKEPNTTNASESPKGGARVTDEVVTIANDRDLAFGRKFATTQPRSFGEIPKDLKKLTLQDVIRLSNDHLEVIIKFYEESGREKIDLSTCKFEINSITYDDKSDTFDFDLRLELQAVKMPNLELTISGNDLLAAFKEIALLKLPAATGIGADVRMAAEAEVDRLRSGLQLFAEDRQPSRPANIPTKSVEEIRQEPASLEAGIQADVTDYVESSQRHDIKVKVTWVKAQQKYVIRVESKDLRDNAHIDVDSIGLEEAVKLYRFEDVEVNAVQKKAALQQEIASKLAEANVLGLDAALIADITKFVNEQMATAKLSEIQAALDKLDKGWIPKRLEAVFGLARTKHKTEIADKITTWNADPANTGDLTKARAFLTQISAELSKSLTDYSVEAQKQTETIEPLLVSAHKLHYKDLEDQLIKLKSDIFQEEPIEPIKEAIEKVKKNLQVRIEILVISKDIFRKLTIVPDSEKSDYDIINDTIQLHIEDPDNLVDYDGMVAFAKWARETVVTEDSRQVRHVKATIDTLVAEGTRIKIEADVTRVRDSVAASTDVVENWRVVNLLEGMIATEKRRGAIALFTGERKQGTMLAVHAAEEINADPELLKPTIERELNLYVLSLQRQDVRVEVLWDAAGQKYDVKVISNTTKDGANVEHTDIESIKLENAIKFYLDETVENEMTSVKAQRRQVLLDHIIEAKNYQSIDLIRAIGFVDTKKDSATLKEIETEIEVIDRAVNPLKIAKLIRDAEAHGYLVIANQLKARLGNAAEMEDYKATQVFLEKRAHDIKYFENLPEYLRNMAVLATLKQEARGRNFVDITAQLELLSTNPVRMADIDATKGAIENFRTELKIRVDLDDLNAEVTQKERLRPTYGSIHAKVTARLGDTAALADHAATRTFIRQMRTEIDAEDAAQVADAKQAIERLVNEANVLGIPEIRLEADSLASTGTVTELWQAVPQFEAVITAEKARRKEVSQDRFRLLVQVAEGLAEPIDTTDFRAEFNRATTLVEIDNLINGLNEQISARGESGSEIVDFRLPEDPSDQEFLLLERTILARARIIGTPLLEAVNAELSVHLNNPSQRKRRLRKLWKKVNPGWNDSEDRIAQANKDLHARVDKLRNEIKAAANRIRFTAEPVAQIDYEFDADNPRDVARVSLELQQRKVSGIYRIPMLQLSSLDLSQATEEDLIKETGRLEILLHDLEQISGADSFRPETEDVNIRFEMFGSQGLAGELGLPEATMAESLRQLLGGSVESVCKVTEGGNSYFVVMGHADNQIVRRLAIAPTGNTIGRLPLASVERITNEQIVNATANRESLVAIVTPKLQQIIEFEQSLGIAPSYNLDDMTLYQLGQLVDNLSRPGARVSAEVRKDPVDIMEKALDSMSSESLRQAAQEAGLEAESEIENQLKVIRIIETAALANAKQSKLEKVEDAIKEKERRKATGDDRSDSLLENINNDKTLFLRFSDDEIIQKREATKKILKIINESGRAGKVEVERTQPTAKDNLRMTMARNIKWLISTPDESLTADANQLIDKEEATDAECEELAVSIETAATTYFEQQKNDLLDVLAASLVNEYITVEQADQIRTFVAGDKEALMPGTIRTAQRRIENFSKDNSETVDRAIAGLAGPMRGVNTILDNHANLRAEHGEEIDRFEADYKRLSLATRLHDLNDIIEFRSHILTFQDTLLTYINQDDEYSADRTGPRRPHEDQADRNTGDFTAQQELLHKEPSMAFEMFKERYSDKVALTLARYPENVTHVTEVKYDSEKREFDVFLRIEQTGNQTVTILQEPKVRLAEAVTLMRRWSQATSTPGQKF